MVATCFNLLSCGRPFSCAQGTWGMHLSFNVVHWVPECATPVRSCRPRCRGAQAGLASVRTQVQRLADAGAMRSGLQVCGLRLPCQEIDSSRGIRRPSLLASARALPLPLPTMRRKPADGWQTTGWTTKLERRWRWKLLPGLPKKGRTKKEAPNSRTSPSSTRYKNMCFGVNIWYKNGTQGTFG